MALPKRVKIGGSYYKGYQLSVGAPTGDYSLEMTIANACVLNAITVIPDEYGAGDYFTILHRNSANNLVETIADTVYNVGANAAWEFDFSALENMSAGDKLVLIYTNVAGVAMNVYTNLERIK